MYARTRCVWSFVAGILLLASLTVCLDTNRSYAQVIAGPIENPDTGNSYLLLSGINWSTDGFARSEADAVALGGHLVTINDANEDDWVYKTFGPKLPSKPGILGIGLNDIRQEGKYVWASGETPSYKNWSNTRSKNYGPQPDGEPDDVVGIAVGFFESGKWLDFNTDETDAIASALVFPVVEITEHVGEQTLGNMAHDESDGAPAPIDEKVVFTELPLEEPATSLKLTEDGSYLIVSHQTGNLVSVYDTKNMDLVASIPCNGARSILCRGDSVFVANYDLGTISVISISKGWTIHNSLKLPVKRIVHIDAACTPNFRNELIVTCHGPGNQAASQESYIYAVDVVADRAREISQSPLASVTADGQTIITQTTFHGSPSGIMRGFDYQDFTKPVKNVRELYSGGGDRPEYYYQVYPSGFFFTREGISGGVPVQQLFSVPGEFVVPDLAQKVFYTISKMEIAAHKLNTQFTTIGQREVVLPANVEDFSRIQDYRPRVTGYLLDYPCAYTRGDVLQMFIPTAEGASIMTTSTKAFASTRPPTNDVSTATTDNSDEVGAQQVPSAQSPLQNSVDMQSLSIEDSLEKQLPSVVSAERSVQVKLDFSLGTRGELISAIPDMTLSEHGELNWKPSNSQIGIHEIKFRVSGSNGVSIIRVPIEVLDAELYQNIDGDLAKFADYRRYDLEPGPYESSYSVDQNKLLVLQGRSLLIFNADGHTLENQLQLPKRYKFVGIRDNKLVAVIEAGGFAVDIIDMQSMKIECSIELEDSWAKVAELTDLAMHPSQKKSYIAVRYEQQFPGYRIVEVDEVAETAIRTDMIGSFVAAMPDGRHLIAGYKDHFRDGNRLEILPNWQMITTPKLGLVDWLLLWDTKRGGTLKGIVGQAGINGSGIRLSPNGNRVVYLSKIGDANFRGDLMGWNASRLNDSPVRYEIKNVGQTSEAAFHPTLPLVAIPTEHAAVVFNEDTGETVEVRLQMPSSGIDKDKIDRLLFAPDGQSLVLFCSGASGRFMKTVGIEIPGQEKLPPRAPSLTFEEQVVKPKIAQQDIQAILTQNSPDRSLTPVEIGERYLDAVVSIQADDKKGTGLVVGKSGFVMTCAHLVEQSSKINVLLNRPPADSERTLASECTATIVHLDEVSDLALLKIEASDRELATIVFSDGQPVTIGTPVVVIASPGLGEETLSRTMTTGIVSNNNRELFGQVLIQTSAAVNPGSSGGAMFDESGHVIGMINMKGNIEGTGFAIPVDIIRAFLASISGDSNTSAVSEDSQPIAK